MAQPLTAGIAPDIVLAPDYILRVTALDPDTGATVSGVVISDVAIQVDTGPDSPIVVTVPAVPPLFAYGATP